MAAINSNLARDPPVLLAWETRIGVRSSSSTAVTFDVMVGRRKEIGRFLWRGDPAQTSTASCCKDHELFFLIVDILRSFYFARSRGAAKRGRARLQTVLIRPSGLIGNW